ncbi:hypothetical protein POM88_018883 [Heracleum sosnowskyi]|uniref:Uncharacterized protein n=1 Tax=Heracleum sosnowskyi TaxID=360622 RepID=A0AAD8MV46_9APIA|nr:hypothetical protein POM88_018883 [Heracleum sosnowskyi]
MVFLVVDRGARGASREGANEAGRETSDDRVYWSSKLIKGVVKDLSAAFFTFQTLSSFFQDSGVEHAHDRARIGGSKAVMIKKGKKVGRRRMPLPPFDLVVLYLEGDIWFINGYC